MTDALEKEASFTYDANGNLLQETSSCGDKFIYTYTKLGEAESVTDEAGSKICMSV